MKLTIIDIARHRNGIDGAPFTAILFDETGPDASRKLAILFDEHHHCAVLDVAKLFAGDIAFGSNSWRGDTYEPTLREAIGTCPPAAPPEIDIDELHAKRREIAIVWSIEDVQQVRPDLTGDQCWEVLETAKDSHDATIGLDWSLLESHAEMLFGAAPETDASGGIAMKKYHVKVAVRILEIYAIEAEDEPDARDLWSDGDLIHTNDEALETEILSVEEV